MTIHTPSPPATHDKPAPAPATPATPADGTAPTPPSDAPDHLDSADDPALTTPSDASQAETDPTVDWPVLDQEIPPTAGHGPARAAALYAAAEAYQAVLAAPSISGSTRSTGPGESVHLLLKVPTQATVRELEDMFSKVETAMEDAARIRRAKAREEFKTAGTLAARTYDLNLVSRSAMVGFGLGVATALAQSRGTKIVRPEGAPTPLKAARFRKGNVNEPALKWGRAAGRKFATEVLLADAHAAIEPGTDAPAA